jgi:hypothetical protein
VDTHRNGTAPPRGSRPAAGAPVTSPDGDALHELLDLLARLEAPLAVAIDRGGLCVRLTVAAAAPAAGAAEPAAVPDQGPSRPSLGEHFFNPTETACVRALAAGPLKTAVLRRRVAGDSNKVKVTLAGLVARGVLRVAREGYEVTDPWFSRVARELAAADLDRASAPGPTAGPPHHRQGPDPRHRPAPGELDRRVLESLAGRPVPKGRLA